MKTNPEEFIAEWIEKNPKGCQALAGAVLYSYFNDEDENLNQRILTLCKVPDAVDLHRELITAIRGTDVVDRVEDIVGDESNRFW